MPKPETSGTPLHRTERAMKPAISVVIPVYKDWVRLERCLAAIECQSLPREQFEVIVVDNADDALDERLRPPGVVYVHEPEGYSYAARNAGLRRSTGDIIVFTDSDCIPDARWLENGRRAIEASGCDLVGGRVEMFADDDNIAAWYQLAFDLRQEIYFKRFHGFATANLLVRRQVCDVIDGFNSRLESWGDFDFCRRAAAAGFRLSYAPEAAVQHPARATLGELLRKNRRVARGFIVFGYERRPKTLKSRLQWFVLLTRPTPRDWYTTLVGGRGSEVLRWTKRPAVLAVQILIRYHFAWAHFRAILETRMARARRLGASGMVNLASEGSQGR